MEIYKRIFSFSGKAKRSEFWFIVLIIAVITLLPAYLLYDPYSIDAKNYVFIMSVLTLWPYLAVQVRRWHDRNKSAWWLLINFIPIVGPLWVLIELGFMGSVNSHKSLSLE